MWAVRLGCVTFAVAGLVLLVIEPRPTAAGAVIVVETNADELQVNGICAVREALGNANVNLQAFADCEAGSGAGDVIMLPPGTITLNAFADSLIPTDDVQFIGDAGGTSAIDGGDAIRVLFASSVSVGLQRVTIQNGNSTTTGGGILVIEGELTFDESKLIDNEAAFNGGGINASESVLFISDSTIADNDAGIAGGGINATGDVTIEGSTISGNDATNVAAGANFGGGSIATSVDITNSTISGNFGEGARVQPQADLNLLNVTITDNETSGVTNSGGAANAQNSILDDACTGAMNSLGNNLDSSGGGCVDAAGPGDIIGGDPMLGSLQDNGGLTETHEIQAGSDAIDAADDDACPVTDQRGEPRPQGAACDIGAFEVSVATPTPTAVPTETETPAATTPVETPADTATPTGTWGTPTPGTETPAVTPTATAPPGEEVAWGDNNCSGPPPDPVDALLALRHDAGLSTNTGDCPDMGAQVDVLIAALRLWGDFDCSDAVDPVDTLKLLRFDAGFSVTQTAGCPQPGAGVSVSEL